MRKPNASPNTTPTMRMMLCRWADVILGPIARATMLAVDRDAMLIQPTHSLLRFRFRQGTAVNHMSGYPRYS